MCELCARLHARRRAACGRATGATLLREATSELANSDDSAAFAELSALSSMCGCPRTMRCASCARDYTHGAELRAGGPQLPCLLAMAAAFLSCPRWRPRRCHSRRPSPVTWDPIVEQLVAVVGVRCCRGE